MPISKSDMALKVLMRSLSIIFGVLDLGGSFLGVTSTLGMSLLEGELRLLSMLPWFVFCSSPLLTIPADVDVGLAMLSGVFKLGVLEVVVAVVGIAVYMVSLVALVVLPIYTTCGCTYFVEGFIKVVVAAKVESDAALLNNNLSITVIGFHDVTSDAPLI